MTEEKKRTYIHGGSLSGALWFFGWLFTIGYINLAWWQIILALIIWPYFLGTALK